MAVPFSNTKLRVPRGFQNLLEGLAREVLRSQPEELYEFGAQYFENLIKLREESGLDPAEHGAKMEDRFYNNKAFSQPEIDPSDPNQQEAALTIQTKFRQHAAKQEVEVIREEQAATKIQAGFRGHQERAENQEEKEAATEGNKETTPEEEVDIDLNDPDVEAAAIKIQASFKGFQTRKTMKSEMAAEESLTQEVPASPVDSTSAAEPNFEEPEIEKEVEPKETVTQQEPESIMETEPVLLQQTVDTGSTEKVVMEVVAESADMCSAPEPEVQLLEEEEVYVEPSEAEAEEAAIKIQAGFKGMQARREVKKLREGSAQSSVAETSKTPEAETEKLDDVTSDKQETAPDAEKELDIDLEDPEVQAAAMKIQASLKGHAARKQMSASGSASQTPTNVEQNIEEENKPSGSDAQQQPETAAVSTEVQEPASEEQTDTNKATTEPEPAAETAPVVEPEGAAKTDADQIGSAEETAPAPTTETTAPKEDPAVPTEPAAEPTSEQPEVEKEPEPEAEKEVQPEVAAAEPEVAAAEPEVAAAEPEVAAAEPEVAAAEPAAATAEPATTEQAAAEPEVAATTEQTKEESAEPQIPPSD